jgi:hypothetical protein
MVTKETKIILLICAIGAILLCIIFGPQVLKYIGGPILF